MTEEQLEMLNELNEMIGLTLLRKEWEANNGSFRYVKGGHIRPITEEGKLWLTLVRHLRQQIWRQQEAMTLNQLKFCYCVNKIVSTS